MMLRCDNPHPHFKDRKCNAMTQATCDMPGSVSVEVICHRCQGPVLFIFDNAGVRV